MDAIQLIRNDHRDVQRLFERFDAACQDGDADEQQRVVRTLVRELSIHAAIEEQFLYPALREAGRAADDERKDDVHRALEEHHAAKLFLLELDRMTPADERYAPKVRVLGFSVRHHIEEEERELLPVLQRALSGRQLRELGATLARAKDAAPTRPHPAAPDEPPGVFVAGAAAALWDRARDLVRESVDVIGSAGRTRARRSARALRELTGEARQAGEQVATQLRERGREAIDEAGERGRQAIGEARERGREVKDAAGAARLAGREVVGGLRERGDGAVRQARRRARAATRGFAGEPSRGPAARAAKRPRGEARDRTMH